MTSTISTYDDLIREQERLTVLLRSQKEIVRQDLREIREELAPLKSAISMVGKFTTRDRSNLLLTTMADTLIDVVIRRLVLNKAGWFTKLVVPFVMKNFSSHMIAEKKAQIFNKIFSFFGKKVDTVEPPFSEENEEDTVENTTAGKEY